MSARANSSEVPHDSVILLSGGLDSAANLALCAALDRPVLALSFRYGQRAARREMIAAAALAAHYEVKHEIVSIEWLGALGGSSLTDLGADIPRLESSELDRADVTTESARAVWVPNRNGLLINAAAAYAERLGAPRVVVGFNREEAQTFPDNSTVYMRRATAALAMSTSNGVEVFSYTSELDKTEIVAELRLRDPEFPFHLIWSCYQGGERPCGCCESCRRFYRATGLPNHAADHGLPR